MQHITGPYYIDCDETNWILVERRTKKEGGRGRPSTTEDKTYDVNISYPWTLESAFNKIMVLTAKDNFNHPIEEIIKALDQAKLDIRSACESIDFPGFPICEKIKEYREEMKEEKQNARRNAPTGQRNSAAKPRKTRSDKCKKR